jgi:ATP synthase protein I
MQAMLISRAFRVALTWQSMAVASVAFVAAALSGSEGFLSAMLGGSIGVIGFLVFHLFSLRPLRSPSAAIRVALRAEAAKIIAVVILLWLSFAAYRDMVVAAFMCSFIVSVLLAGIASAISGDSLNSPRF